MIINTTDEFIRALRENPDFRDAARRELLSAELLELPAVVAAFKAEFDEFRSKTESDISELKADVAELKTDVAELKVDVAELKTDVAELKTDVAGLKVDVSGLKGRVFGMEIDRTLLPLIVRELRMRRTRVVRLAEYNRASEVFNESAWDAHDAGIISDREYDRLIVTDLIVQGILKDNPATTVFAVAEASYTADEDDIDRILQSAEVVQKVFPDAAVFPFLFCESISDAVRESASERNIKVMLG